MIRASYRGSEQRPGHGCYCSVVDELSKIADAIRSRQYLVSRHASERLASRGISFAVVAEAIIKQRVFLVERRSADRRGPSCLVALRTGRGVLHAVFGVGDTVILVTVYEPDERFDETGLERRSRSGD